MVVVVVAVVAVVVVVVVVVAVTRQDFKELATTVTRKGIRKTRVGRKIPTQVCAQRTTRLQKTKKQGQHRLRC